MYQTIDGQKYSVYVLKDGKPVSFEVRAFPNGKVWGENLIKGKKHGTMWAQSYLLLPSGYVLWVYKDLRDEITRRGGDTVGTELQVLRQGTGPHTHYIAVIEQRANVEPQAPLNPAIAAKNPCECGAHKSGIKPFQVGHGDWCDVSHLKRA